MKNHSKKLEKGKRKCNQLNFYRNQKQDTLQWRLNDLFLNQITFKSIPTPMSIGIPKIGYEKIDIPSNEFLVLALAREQMRRHMATIELVPAHIRAHTNRIAFNYNLAPLCRSC